MKNTYIHTHTENHHLFYKNTEADGPDKHIRMVVFVEKGLGKRALVYHDHIP